MANVALSPGVGPAHLVESECCKFTASHFVEWRQLISIYIDLEFLGIPVGLHVTVPRLSVNAEAPSVHVSLV